MEVLDSNFSTNTDATNAPTSDEKMWAIVAHLSAIVHGFGGFFAFLCPLAIMLAYKDQSEFVYEQAREALNFQISLIILQVIAVCVSLTIIGIPIGIAIWIFMGIGSWLFPIIAAIRLSNGERYRYPFTIRMV
jgi:uncharacterized protein